MESSLFHFLLIPLKNFSNKRIMTPTVHGPWPPNLTRESKKDKSPSIHCHINSKRFQWIGACRDFNPKVATYLHHWWRKSTRSQNTIHLVNSCGVCWDLGDLCWDLGELYPSNFNNFSSQMRLRTHYLVFLGFVWLTRLNSRAFSRHGHGHVIWSFLSSY